MATNEIKIKISIDGKEAIATLNLTENTINELSEAFQGFGRTSQQVSNQIVQSFDNARVMIEGFQRTYEVLRNAFAQPIRLAANFEQYQATLEVMLGSTELAKQRLQELVDFAAHTPFQLPQVIEAANQLQALGRYSRETLTMLGDLAAASGKPIEQAIRAYAKLVTGQKGIAVDMFRDLLISVDDWVAATGKGIKANGELEASYQELADVLPKILEMKNFAGLMGKQSETLAGQLSNLTDSIDQFKTSMGGAIAVGLSPMLKSLSDVLNVLNSAPPAISGTIGAITALTGTLVILKVTGLLPVIRQIMTMKISLKTLPADTAEASAGFLGLSGALRAAGVAAKGFFASLGPIGWLTIGIGTALEVWGIVSSQMDEAKEKTKEAESELDRYKQKLQSMTEEELGEEISILWDAQLKAQKEADQEALKLTKQKYQLLKKEFKRREEEKKKIEIEKNAEALDAVKKLRIEALGEGKEKEILALNYWYEKQKEKYAENEAVLEALENTYFAKRRKIEEKYRQESLKAQEAYLRRNLELNQKMMELEERPQSEILEAKKKVLHQIADLYAESSPERNRILQEIALLQIDIEKALKEEHAVKIQLKAELNEAEFQEELARMKRDLIAQGRGEEIEFITFDLMIQKNREAIQKIQNDQSLGDEERKAKIKQLNAEILDLQAQRAQREIELEKQKNETIRQLGMQTWNDLKSVVNEYYSQQRAKARKQIEEEFEKRKQALETERQKRLEHAKTQRAKDLINKQYDQKEAQLEKEKERRLAEAAKKGFAIQQAIAITETIMNTAQAVMKAWAEAGPVAGPILSGIITALGAAKIALIKSQKPPAFAEGGLFEGEGSGTDDKNLIRISNREFIVNNRMTEKHLTLLEAINTDRVRYADLGAVVKQLQEVNLRLVRVEQASLNVSERPIKIDEVSAKIPRYETKAIVEVGSYNQERLKL
ncbi:hypothetical protein Calab_1444 [Caldithrix abyssi DSM 13497]|uniref:Tape measure protein N-terminal domain-containing protein n=1 Tax=Caldithrix abyssi DSM 13497 TaxID=880073 RepID=H1XPT9_CALAY|nr:tape measure protein [Caldithrix abyssi]APF20408.1 hypothetical protein Cabys_3662 [Caldithrix abyssi DSM 13497]EHO41065.1 hypothetical protein Calab_1444 [Caldithrix abyssi DSM 13497]